MIEQGVRSYFEKIFIDPVFTRLSTIVSPNLVTTMSGVFGVLVFQAFCILFRCEMAVIVVFKVSLSGAERLRYMIDRFHNQLIYNVHLKFDK